MAQVSLCGRTQRSSLRCWYAHILNRPIQLEQFDPPLGDQEEGSGLFGPVRVYVEARCEFMLRLLRAYGHLKSSLSVTMVLEGLCSVKTAPVPLDCGRHCSRIQGKSTLQGRFRVQWQSHTGMKSIDGVLPFGIRCRSTRSVSTSRAERCAPGGHMCHGLMGVTNHILQSSSTKPL